MLKPLLNERQHGCHQPFWDIGGCFSPTSAFSAVSSYGFQDLALWTEPCSQWTIHHTVNHLPPVSRTVGHSLLPTDSVFMTHLLATVYSPPPNSMVSCESSQSMEKISHLLPRLLAPAAWLHPHTGNSVLLRGCAVSCLHIFALLMSFAVWSSPGHSCDVMSCVPKARRLWCVLQKTSSGQIKFRSSKEWSSWLQSSVNKPIEYTEWGVSKQKNIQSRLCINWLISTDERLIRISAFFFSCLSAYSVTLWNV